MRILRLVSHWMPGPNKQCKGLHNKSKIFKENKQKYFALKCSTQGAPKAKRLDIRQHALKTAKN